MLRSISLAFVAALMLALGLASEARTDTADATNNGTVEIQNGEEIVMAVVADHSGPLPDIGEGSLNATRMAIDDYGLIRGFGVIVNDFDGGCDEAKGALAAAAVVADLTRTLGVIGHTCSPSMIAGLPVYEAAKLVAISGSATSTELTAAGPTVFNRTIPDEPNDWQGFSDKVRSQQQFTEWAGRYNDYVAANTAGGEAGPLGSVADPPQFAEFFYDAAMLLLTRIDEVATVDGEGDLVIDRSALAAAVRATTDFRGVTCDITLDAGGTRVPDPDDLAPCDNTPTGDDVSVSFPGGVDVTFFDVADGGATTVTTSTEGPAPPAALQIVGIDGEPVYYDINTTATFSGLVTVCLAYDETQVTGEESDLELWHYDGVAFIDITSSLDTANDIICGETDTLSLFAVMETVPAGASVIWGDVDCKGDAPNEVATRDSQAILRHVLEQNPLSQDDPCPEIGQIVSVDGVERTWGDVDCKGDAPNEVATRDSQAILRNVLEQNPLSQGDLCPAIGAEVEVTIPLSAARVESSEL